jgi:MFS family permease
MTTVLPAPPNKQAIKAAWAAAIGTTLEWYDFGIYGVVAALVLNTQFFPTLNPAIGTIAAFSTFTVGFLARPAGALIFGGIGDRWGRKNTLIVTLIMTGVITVLIGVLPTYAQIGIAAPIILVSLRILQGIGLGGEWGGSALLSTEHAPKARRSFFGGLMAIGVPLGTLISYAAFLAITLFVPQAPFIAWGWRIPFLAASIILIVGIWIRVGIDETPQFLAAKAKAKLEPAARIPVTEVFRHYPVKIVIGTLFAVGSSAVAYVYLTFLLSWGVGTVGYTIPTLLSGICAGAIVWAATAPIWARIGDRPGGMRQIFLVWGIVRSLSVIPFFLMVASGNLVLFYIAMALFGAVISTTQVPAGAAIASLFPVHVRYTGASFSYQLGAILGGGVTPLVASALVATKLGIAGVVGYIVLLSLISAAAGLYLSRTEISTPKAENEPELATRA